LKKSNENSYYRIYNILKKLDTEYTPSISESVDSLEKYAAKISEFAEVFFVVNHFEDIGFCAIYCNNKVEKVAFITSIAIMSKFQGKGISSNLFKEVYKFVNSLEFNKIELEVNKGNLKAIKFYEKKGFKKKKTKESSIIMSIKI